MTNKITALILTGLLAACHSGTTNEQNSSQGGNAPSQSNNQEVSESAGSISEARTTAFKSLMPLVSDMRKMANGDIAFEPDVFKTKAAQFAKEAHEPFEYFQNDPNGNGGALPVIWQKPADFKAQQEKFFAAVDKLNAAAQTGKLDEIKIAMDDVNANCKSCHASFRATK